MMKQRRREPGSGVSSPRSNILRSMQGHIPKIPNFLAFRNQRQEENAASHCKMTLFRQSASLSAPAASTTQGKRSSDTNRRPFTLCRPFTRALHTTVLTFRPPIQQMQLYLNVHVERETSQIFSPNLHPLLKQYQTLPFNSLKKLVFPRLSEKSRHLLRKHYQFSNKIPRHWWDRWRFSKPKIKRCRIYYLRNQNWINCQLII